MTMTDPRVSELAAQADAYTSNVLYRDLKRTFPVVVRGEGIYVYDDEGRRYIDGSGGSSVVSSIGHGVPEVVAAMTEQARTLALAPTHVFTTVPLMELSATVARWTDGRLSRVWLGSNGSDATEDAVALARQYWVARGLPGKHLVISRWRGFHGNSLGARGFSGHTARRRDYLPMIFTPPHIGPAYCYRCPWEKTYPDCDLLCARSLEQEIIQQGAENVAAFIAEPVVGAALGAVPAPPGYFQRVREICDRYDVLFISDEVMTAWGRTGKPFGLDHWGVTPDIMATAKGMGAGYTPISAVVAREGIVAALRDADVNFIAGHTYSSNPLSCAVSLAVLRYTEQHNLVENARVQGERLFRGLERLRRRRIVGDVRGLGLLAGVELVADQATKAPLPVSPRAGNVVGEEALKRGLIVFPCTGAVDGQRGDMILLAPPLVITASQIDDLVDILEEALEAAAARLLGEPAHSSR